MNIADLNKQLKTSGSIYRLAESQESIFLIDVAGSEICQLPSDDLEEFVADLISDEQDCLAN